MRRVSAFLGLGAAAVVLAAVPYKVFDLDRYFVPKELVLHLTAVVLVLAMVVAMGRGRTTSRPARAPLTRVDTLLLIFLVFSALSTAQAPNRWLAWRAFAVSVSGVAVFWVTLALARAGRARSLIVVVATAVVIGAAVALLQAYGVESEYFSINRAPGGTLGNRNFVAHLAAIGMPVLVVATLRARRTRSGLLGAVAVAIVAAAIVLSRSRAAWVAIAIAALCIAPTILRARRISQSREARRAPDPTVGAARLRRQVDVPTTGPLRARSVMLLVAAVAGVCAAISLPNSLNWRSASPYLDSVLGVTNYREGSGHGRLVQYGNTARLALSHPLLGVGPGNWAVAYPRVASRNDPSLDPDDGMTANPWPSSDWAAFVAERGVPATACLTLALVGLLVGAHRAADAAAEDGRVDRLVPALALTATVITLIVVGAFDAVLLLAAPSLIAWAALGALAGALVPAPTTRLTLPTTLWPRRALLLAVAAVGGIAIGRSAAQLTAMTLYATAPTPATRTLQLAAHIDPGNYRIHMRLAQTYLEEHSCTRARPQALAARALFPHAPEPRRLLALCSGRTR